MYVLCIYVFIFKLESTNKQVTQLMVINLSALNFVYIFYSHTFMNMAQKSAVWHIRNLKPITISCKTTNGSAVGIRLSNAF